MTRRLAYRVQRLEDAMGVRPTGWDPRPAVRAMLADPAAIDAADELNKALAEAGVEGIDDPAALEAAVESSERLACAMSVMTQRWGSVLHASI